MNYITDFSVGNIYRDNILLGYFLFTERYFQLPPDEH